MQAKINITVVGIDIVKELDLTITIMLVETTEGEIVVMVTFFVPELLK